MKDPAGRASAIRLRPPSVESTRRALPGHQGRHRAVFIDRDGVLNEDTIHAHDPRSLVRISGGDEAMKGLKGIGYLRVVITNQAGIAKGLFTEQDLLEFSEELWTELGEEPWDACYYCPYHATGTVEGFILDSPDRKPKPGMILRAALDMDIDVPNSYMIGDHLKDVVAAHRAGCKGILVMTGRGKKELERFLSEDTPYGSEAAPDAMAQDLYNAYLMIREWGA